MAYVDVPNTVLEVDDPVRSVDIVQMNDNTKDHQTRLIALEDPSSILSHFEVNHRYPSGIVIDSSGVLDTTPASFGATPKTSYADPRFTLYVNNGKWTEMIAGSTTDQHFLRAAPSGAGTGEAAIECVTAIYFDNRTKPVTFTTRLKLSANPSSTTALFIGMHDGQRAIARPTNGVYLEVVTATTWRFTTSRAGSNTLGATFTPPTAGTWFELQIVLRSSPSNAADCYIDAVLKETASGANLPTDRQLFTNVSWSPPTGSNFDVDRFKLASAGIADSA